MKQESQSHKNTKRNRKTISRFWHTSQLVFRYRADYGTALLIAL